MTETAAILSIWSLHYWIVFPPVIIIITGIRNALLTPNFGQKRSDFIEKLLFLISALIISYFFYDITELLTYGALLLTGLAWAFLEFISDFLIKRVIFREPLFLFYESYNPRKGNLGSLVTVLMILVPLAIALIARK